MIAETPPTAPTPPQNATVGHAKRYPWSCLTGRGMTAFAKLADGEIQGVTLRSVEFMLRRGLLAYEIVEAGRDKIGVVTAPRYYVPEPLLSQWREFVANGGWNER